MKIKVNYIVDGVISVYDGRYKDSYHIDATFTFNAYSDNDYKFFITDIFVI